MRPFSEATVLNPKCGLTQYALFGASRISLVCKTNLHASTTLLSCVYVKPRGVKLRWRRSVVTPYDGSDAASIELLSVASIYVLPKR